VSLWDLSKDGKKQAEKIIDLPVMKEVGVIYASEEKKTTLTVVPLAKELGKEIKTLMFFNEAKEDINS